MTSQTLREQRKRVAVSLRSQGVQAIQIATILGIDVTTLKYYRKVDKNFAVAWNDAVAGWNARLEVWGKQWSELEARDGK